MSDPPTMAKAARISDPMGFQLDITALEALRQAPTDQIMLEIYGKSSMKDL